MAGKRKNHKPRREMTSEEIDMAVKAEKLLDMGFAPENMGEMFEFDEEAADYADPDGGEVSDYLFEGGDFEEQRMMRLGPNARMLYLLALLKRCDPYFQLWGEADELYAEAKREYDNAFAALTDYLAGKGKGSRLKSASSALARIHTAIGKYLNEIYDRGEEPDALVLIVFDAMDCLGQLIFMTFEGCDDAVCHDTLLSIRSMEVVTFTECLTELLEGDPKIVDTIPDAYWTFEQMVECAICDSLADLPDADVRDRKVISGILKTAMKPEYNLTPEQLKAAIAKAEH